MIRINKICFPKIFEKLHMFIIIEKETFVSYLLKKYCSFPFFALFF